MPKLKKKSSFEELSNEDIALRGIDYVNKKEAIKELDSQCKEVRKPLEDYVKSSGKTLDSGSILAVVSHADVDVHLQQTLRVGKVLLPEAMDVIKSLGLHECLEKVTIIREDVLEQMFLDEKISGEQLALIYQETSSYAFSVKLKPRCGDEPE